jgi:hypothetical protein
MNRIIINKQFDKICNANLDFLLKVAKYHYINRSPQKEKNFPDKWNLAKSASVLISSLAVCSDERTIDFVFEFIKEYTHSENSKIKESVLMAYGSILDSIHKNRIKEIIEGSLPTLMNLLSDKSFDVRTTVSWVIKKICKYHTDVIIHLQNTNPNLLKNFIEALIQHLNSNKKVVMNLIESINLLSINCKKLKGENYQNSILSSYYQIIMDNLVQVAYMPEAISNENNIAINAFYTISSLIEYAPYDTYHLLQGYFSQFVNLLIDTKEVSKFQNEEQRLLYQEYLCSIISSYLMEEKMCLNMDQAKFIFSLIKAFFLERGTVFDTGISLCSSIALNIGKNFKELIEEYGSFLYHALGMWNAEMICKSAIMSVSDLIRALGRDFDPYIDQIIPIVFNIIQVNYIKYNYYYLFYKFILFYFIIFIFRIPYAIKL